MNTTEQTDYRPDSWEYDECQCGTLGWVNGEGKCSECENPCTHDWYFINGDDGEMKCAHCGECQN